ncbi:MAG: hypothetical protein B7Z41_03650 [Rhizobiales bacterium 12-66-7]|nr:MAG: hypothetical protein B7Z41_03650 [Rhizobiales bacterium 12-66-7]
MAGIILMAAGFARLGNFMRYIPEPVVTGFTAGIAVIIFSSQVKDFFGLTIAHLPAEFIGQWEALIKAAPTVSLATAALSISALAIILILRRVAPKAPGFLIVVLLGSLAVMYLKLPVDTIGTRFGGISGALPAPSFPTITFARIGDLLPSALTIAFLAGPIARTATNIRAGARTPVSGVMHAAFVLAVMLLLAPLAVYVPLASLAAILMVVAWNMSEIGKIRHLMSAPVGDRLLLLSTLGLTVAVDLTVAIAVGVVLAAVIFMHRMAGMTRVEVFSNGEDGEGDVRALLPPGVEAFDVSGPLFFGAAAHLSEVLDQIGQMPRVFILRMEEVADRTGAAPHGPCAGW